MRTCNTGAVTNSSITERELRTRRLAGAVLGGSRDRAITAASEVREYLPSCSQRATRGGPQGLRSRHQVWLRARIQKPRRPGQPASSQPAFPPAAQPHCQSPVTNTGHTPARSPAPNSSASTTTPGAKRFGSRLTIRLRGGRIRWPGADRPSAVPERSPGVRSPAGSGTALA